MLIHHPRRGLPWVWWLSAGRDCLVPPEAVGVLHQELLDHWYSQLDGEGWSLDPSVHRHLDSVPSVEGLIYRPWVNMYLTQLARVSSRVILGEILDPLLVHFCVLEPLTTWFEARHSIRLSYRCGWWPQ